MLGNINIKKKQIIKTTKAGHKRPTFRSVIYT